MCIWHFHFSWKYEIKMGHKLPSFSPYCFLHKKMKIVKQRRFILTIKETITLRFTLTIKSQIGQRLKMIIFFHKFRSVAWDRVWCLMPLSTIFQLYRGGLFYWLRRAEYTEKTVDKLLTSFTTYCCIEYILPWTGFELTT